MNLFRIHIRPDGGTEDMVATFQHCLDNELLGVGWRVDGLHNTRDWGEYEQQAEPVHISIQQPRFIHRNVLPGDLVWTRDPRSKYYLARVSSGWEYWTTAQGEEQNIDIANIFRCEFHEVKLDMVPGKVVSSFGNRGRTIQSINDRSARAYSQYLWNEYAGQCNYEVELADFPDIFAMLDPEETEDLVFLYLQSLGWYVIPNSRKGNTHRFEFMLACSDTGEKALTQVKTGNARLNCDHYADDSQRIFLFQSNEHYDGQCADNITCIRRNDLAAFLEQYVELFPQSFRTKLNMTRGR